ncbi:uncharacterized protein LOC130673859 [Microplitis mediator]|uniref:uncharacterized protein LOC130673859 n=1 Tax=Microplitis mediator TaxID=375433 RepID=UPI002555A9C5|nr:uncharacterized protein LOC130673859 [Microplitis mediator]
MTKHNKDATPAAAAQIVTSPMFATPPPVFNPKTTALWFAQLEARFETHDIADEKQKFIHAVSLLDADAAVEVEALIVTPPAVNPYTQLKETLIKCFSASESSKLRKLLDGEAIGDRTPTQFLRHLKALAPRIDEAVIKAKWIANLPKKTQELLSISPDNATLDQLAKTADKIHEVYLEKHTVAAASATPETLPLEKLVAELAQQVASLANDLHQERGRSKHRGYNPASRSLSRSLLKPRLKKSGLYRFHEKYGAQAFRCIPGCKFQENASGSQ